MSAIVRANSKLSSGDIAIIRRSVTSQRDGTVVLQAEYCCLASFRSRWQSAFVRGASPVKGVPDSLGALGATKPPTLYDVTVKTENGLTYFTAMYSAGLSRETTITETEEQRHWSGVVKYKYGSTGGVIFTTPYSFDYLSKSVTVAGLNEYPFQQDGSVGLPFNKSFNFALNDQQIIGLNLPTATTIVSRTKTQSSLGEFTFSTTSTGIYESDDSA